MQSFFLFLHRNIFCVYSLEAPPHPQHMFLFFFFLWRNKNNIIFSTAKKTNKKKKKKKKKKKTHTLSGAMLDYFMLYLKILVERQTW